MGIISRKLIEHTEVETIGETLAHFDGNTPKSLADLVTSFNRSVVLADEIYMSFAAKGEIGIKAGSTSLKDYDLKMWTGTREVKSKRTLPFFTRKKRILSHTVFEFVSSEPESEMVWRYGCGGGPLVPGLRNPPGSHEPDVLRIYSEGNDERVFVRVQDYKLIRHDEMHRDKENKYFGDHWGEFYKLDGLLLNCFEMRNRTEPYPKSLFEKSRNYISLIRNLPFVLSEAREKGVLLVREEDEARHELCDLNALAESAEGFVGLLQQ